MAEPTRSMDGQEIEHTPDYPGERRRGRPSVLIDKRQSQEIRQRRERMRLTEYELAQMTQVSEKTVWAIENVRDAHWFALYTVRSIREVLWGGIGQTVRYRLVSEMGYQGGEPFLLLRDGERFTIGRAEDCYIRIPKEDQYAGRHHAQLEAGPAGLVVCDLQSKNGTWVKRPSKGSREEEEVTVPTPLRHGDHLRCGQTVWVVEEVDDPERTKTGP